MNVPTKKHSHLGCASISHKTAQDFLILHNQVNSQENNQDEKNQLNDSFNKADNQKNNHGADQPHDG